jgi:hypothetical protein
MTALKRTPAKVPLGNLAGCASQSFGTGNKNQRNFIRHMLFGGLIPHAIIAEGQGNAVSKQSHIPVLQDEYVPSLAG